MLYVLTALWIYFAVKPLTWIVMYQKNNISKDDAERGGNPSPPEEESDEEDDDEDDDDMDLDRTAALQSMENKNVMVLVFFQEKMNKELLNATDL